MMDDAAPAVEVCLQSRRDGLITMTPMLSPVLTRKNYGQALGSCLIPVMTFVIFRRNTDAQAACITMTLAQSRGTNTPQRDTNATKHGNGKKIKYQRAKSTISNA